MTPSQKMLSKLGLKDQDKREEENALPGAVEKENSRRSFIKKSALGGIALGGDFMFSQIEALVAQRTQNVNRCSTPSGLKITDQRYAITTVLRRTAKIR